MYRSLYAEVYPDEDADVDDFIEEGASSLSWWTLGEDGAEDSGVAISSMSAYGLEPFLLKALLKELRSCGERKYLRNKVIGLKSKSEYNKLS